MRLVVLLAISLTLRAFAAEISIDGEWVRSVNEKELWDAFAAQNPASAAKMTEDEKKHVIALSTAQTQSTVWVFGKDGSFQVHSVITRKLVDDTRELMKRMEQTPRVKKDLARLEKIKPDVPDVQFKGEWKLDGKKIAIQMKSPDDSTVLPTTATVIDDGITLEDGTKLVTKK